MNSRIKTMRRGIFPTAIFTCSLLLLASALPVQAESPTASQYGTILNLSGKQRMLTQKMSKEVVLVALDIDKALNIERLAQTAELFEVTLKGLKDGNGSLRLAATTNPGIINQLDVVNGLWTEFHGEIQSILEAHSVTPEQLAFIAEKNLPLLKEMNQVVKMYEKDAGAGK